MAAPARGKRVRFGDEARLALLRGANVLADTVQPTLGPAGRSVMIERPFARPVVSRNGYAIAKLVELADPSANMGVRALREVAWRTSDAVGDGTTTAIVLARAMVAGGIRAAAAGLDPRHLQLGFDRATTAVREWLAALARPADTASALTRVGTLALGGDAEIGELLAEAVRRTGPEGFVLVEEGHGRHSELEIRDGMHLDKGYVSAHFVTDEGRALVELEDPYILMHLGRIEQLEAIVPALNAFAKAGKPLLFVAEDVVGDALAALVVNKRKAGFKVAAVHAPGYGPSRREMLEDLAIATGGRIVSDDLGNKLENLRPEMLGRAKRVRITRDATTIINGAGPPDEIAFRARQLRAAIEREQHLSYDREQLQQRLARLVSGIAVVRVGGATESELEERKERVTAATQTVSVADASGVVPGGGAALLRAGRGLEHLEPASDAERAAIGIVRAALQVPARQIADNAGIDGRWAVARALDSDDPAFGLDAASGRFGDLIEAGVIDAAGVVSTAFGNAASTAARLLACEAAIAPKESTHD